MLEIGNLLLSAQRRKRIGEAKRRELAAAAAALRQHVDCGPARSRHGRRLAELTARAGQLAGVACTPTIATMLGAQNKGGQLALPAP